MVHTFSGNLDTIISVISLEKDSYQLLLANPHRCQGMGVLVTKEVRNKALQHTPWPHFRTKLQRLATSSICNHLIQNCLSQSQSFTSLGKRLSTSSHHKLEIPATHKTPTGLKITAKLLQQHPKETDLLHTSSLCGQKGSPWSLGPLIAL